MTAQIYELPIAPQYYGEASEDVQNLIASNQKYLQSLGMHLLQIKNESTDCEIEYWGNFDATLITGDGGYIDDQFIGFSEFDCFEPRY